MNRESSSIISRLTDRVEMSTLPSMDCFLPDQDKFLKSYGGSILSFSKCCSICQKAKLYAIELSSCKHKYYDQPQHEQIFSECCYSRLYQTNRLLSSSTQNDLLKASNENFNGRQWMTASQLTLDLINGQPQISPQQQIVQSLNQRNPFNSQSTNNRESNAYTNLHSYSLQQPIHSSISNTNEIFHQLQLNVDIEKVYLSKAKLMLNLKKANESLITNLTDDERNLILKALDTTKLDDSIKRLTNLLQNSNSNSNLQSNSDLYSSNINPFANHSGSNDHLPNEPVNRPSAANLIDQLQLLFGNTDRRWTVPIGINGTVDHYSSAQPTVSPSLNINLPTIQDETAGSFFEEDSDAFNMSEDEINLF